MKYPCSAYDKVDGIVYFARMLDKIRLKAEDALPLAYHSNLGTGLFDARCCQFLGVSYTAVLERVHQGGTDNEILYWCFDMGQKPNNAQVEIWNDYATKKGFRDDFTEKLKSFKVQGGLTDRNEIQTLFDYYEFDEGRAK